MTIAWSVCLSIHALDLARNAWAGPGQKAA